MLVMQSLYQAPAFPSRQTQPQHSFGCQFHRIHRRVRSGGKLAKARPVATSTSASAAQEVPTAAATLLKVIEATKRGAATSKEARRQIDAAIAALEKEPTCQSDDGTWRLLWTTEKETLFIIKTNWFGAKAGEVYQIIDRQEGYLQNVITFPPKSAVLVGSTIEPEGYRRVNFKFTSAQLQLKERTISLPPVGKGWFVNVYCDDKIRVSKDIRGDILVTERAGPPQRFTRL